MKDGEGLFEVTIEDIQDASTRHPITVSKDPETQQRSANTTLRIAQNPPYQESVSDYIKTLRTQAEKGEVDPDEMAPLSNKMKQRANEAITNGTSVDAGMQICAYTAVLTAMERANSQT